VTTTGYALLAIVIGVVWFAVIFVWALWASRNETHPA
jgi:hypothetical protein